VGVVVEEVLPVLDKTTALIYLRISAPTRGQLYQITVSGLFDLDGSSHPAVSSTWTHVRTKTDAVLNSLPRMYSAGSSNLRSILEAISLIDEEIGGN